MNKISQTTNTNPELGGFMKKKTIIIGLCLASCLGITGCGSSQDAVVSNLSNQIDYLNNTVNAINRNMSNVPNISLENNLDENLTGVYQATKDIYNNQTSYKTAISTKNAMIKKAITNKELKLTEQDKKALIDLTTALSKNTRSLDESRSELVRAATDVSRNYKDRNSSTTQISAKVNRLSNCMNSQSSYYKNLINTLNSIENILNIDDSSFDYNNLDKTVDENAKKEDNSKNMQDLLYNYLLNDLNNKNNSDNNKNFTTYPSKDMERPCNDGNCNKTGTINQNNCPNGACPPTNNTTNKGVANNNITNNATYNNGIYNNGIYNGNYNRITNPSRNTDTYQPLNKNIDTYRPFAPGYYNSPLTNNGTTTVDTHPVPVDENTDIRRNNNTNQVDNSNHHRRHPIRHTPRIEAINTKDIKKTNDINNVKKKDLSENKKQTFVGKTEKLNNSSLNLDINQKIRDLIKKKEKETFNNSNFLKLR